jgi:hypothetical protein
LDAGIAAAKWDEDAETVVAAIRGYLNEASEGLWDAMLAGRRNQRRLAIPAHLNSQVANEVRENAEKLQPPLPPQRSLFSKLFSSWW